MKNVQDCHCGTKSCRGYLGPKPKHATIVSGAKAVGAAIGGGVKRAFGAVLGPGSGSAPNSPKKRKTNPHSATTKKENAIAEKAAEREKTERLKAEAVAQAASRKDRALHRSTSTSILSARHTKKKLIRRAVPIKKTTRHMTVDYKRKISKTGLAKPGALKRITKTVKRTAGPPSKSQASMPNTPKRPARSVSPDAESESEDESPNITPASLRSAQKKQLKQTQLNFKPLTYDGSSSSASDSLKFPDSDDDSDIFDPRNKRPKKGSASMKSAKGSIKKSSASTKSAPASAKRSSISVKSAGGSARQGPPTIYNRKSLFG